MALDDAGIDQIIETVGATAPKGIDRNSLKADLEEAWQTFCIYGQQSSKGNRSKQRELAREISKSASALAKLLDNPKHSEWVLQHLGAAFPLCEGMPVSETQWDTGRDGSAVNIRRVTDPLRRYEQPSFRGLKAGLLKLSDRAAHVVQLQTAPSLWRKHIKVTPLTWLVGHDLTKVYELYFHRPAGISHRRGVKEPYGPYVRFSVAVLGAFGDKISAHTVESAFKDVRALIGGKPPGP